MHHIQTVDQAMVAEHTGPSAPTNSLTQSFNEKYYDPSH